MVWIGVVTVLLFLLFVYSYLREPRRIMNGLLFNVFVISFLLLCSVYAVRTDIQALKFLIVIPIIILVIIIPFGIIALIVGLFINARVLIRKEGRRLANSLTMITALGIIFILIIRQLNPSQYVSDHLQPLFGGVSLVMLYFFLNLLNFFTAYTLYQFNRPKYRQDFIIVLGSGLIKDKVPPLLASRIDKAIEFYNKQKTKTTPPKIILSGGQGADESLPEAEAMQQYAIQHGIPAKDTIQENRSINTYQNMKFSKELLDQLSPNEPYNSIFTTNNFHLFRAGIYARKVGLDSQGIGAKTALYYWPNAMVREYIAIISLKRKQHLVVVIGIMAVSILLSIISWLFVY